MWLCPSIKYTAFYHSAIADLLPWCVPTQVCIMVTFCSLYCCTERSGVHAAGHLHLCNKMVWMHITVVDWPIVPKSLGGLSYFSWTPLCHLHPPFKSAEALWHFADPCILPLSSWQFHKSYSTGGHLAAVWVTCEVVLRRVVSHYFQSMLLNMMQGAFLGLHLQWKIPCII